MPHSQANVVVVMTPPSKWVTTGTAAPASSMAPASATRVEPLL